MTDRNPHEIAPEQLRWTCDPSTLGFETTATVDPASRIIGQETAQDALLFGLQTTAPGQNIYVRGQRGTGRLTMVKLMLEQLALTTSDKRDICYVHNFRNPDRPRLVTLPPGCARPFNRRIQELAKFVQDGLVKALDSEPYALQRAELKAKHKEKIAAISESLENDLQENDMALVPIQQGNVSVPVIAPLVDGKPVQPNQFQKLIQEGKADESQ
ncbi:MAG: Lon-like protease helical domain-containing protein, partial [Pirellulaceae bacterium]